jgi:hypothetical protein
MVERTKIDMLVVLILFLLSERKSLTGWGTRCIGCRMTRLGFGLCMRVNPKKINGTMRVEEVTILEQSALRGHLLKAQ